MEALQLAQAQYHWYANKLSREDTEMLLAKAINDQRTPEEQNRIRTVCEHFAAGRFLDAWNTFEKCNSITRDNVPARLIHEMQLKNEQAS